MIDELFQGLGLLAGATGKNFTSVSLQPIVACFFVIIKMEIPPNAMTGTSSVASINDNEPDNEPRLSLERASLVCKEEATNLPLEKPAADVHILIELDLSSSSSFAFFGECSSSKFSRRVPP